MKMKKPAKPYAMRVFGGADNAIRTRDLILTKDVLCRLSYISVFNFPGKKVAHNPAHNGDELR